MVHTLVEKMWLKKMLRHNSCKREDPDSENCEERNVDA